MRANVYFVIAALVIAVAAVGTTFASAGFVGANRASPAAAFGALSDFPANGGTDANLTDERVQDLQRALRHTIR